MYKERYTFEYLFTTLFVCVLSINYLLFRAQPVEIQALCFAIIPLATTGIMKYCSMSYFILDLFNY